VAGARTAERIQDRVGDRIVVDDVETDRAVAGAGVNGHRVRTGAGDARNRSAGDAGGGEREVAGVDAGNGLTERAGEVDAEGVGRRQAGARDRLNGRRGLVDRVRLAVGQRSVAGAGAAQWVAGEIGDRVVVDEVEIDDAVAAACVDADRRGRAADDDAG